MTLTGSVIQNIIRKLLAGQDYRAEVVALIDAEFLQYVIQFFERIAAAKLKNESVTVDWYKRELLSSNLPSDEIAIHAGLNIKTIDNMYNSTRRNVVLEASLEHYETLRRVIEDLATQNEVDITLTLKFRGVSVDLNVNESLVVINTIAVKRSALRGGLWSTAGKQVEKPLMKTLCTLFRVPIKYWDQSRLPESLREVDFYLIDGNGKLHRCEVKLMGKGNPESADAVHARQTSVFIADKLSDLNKRQLDESGILWVELRDKDSFKRFQHILNALAIPSKPYKGNVQKALDKILPVIVNDDPEPKWFSRSLRESSPEYDSGLLLEFGDEL